MIRSVFVCAGIGAGAPRQDHRSQLWHHGRSLLSGRWSPEKGTPVQRALSAADGGRDNLSAPAGHLPAHRRGLVRGKPAPRTRRRTAYRSAPLSGGCVQKDIKHFCCPERLFFCVAGELLSREMNVQLAVPVLDTQYVTGADAAIREPHLFKAKNHIPPVIVRFCPVRSSAPRKQIPQAAAIFLLIEHTAQGLKFITVFFHYKFRLLCLHSNFIVSMKFCAFIGVKHGIALQKSHWPAVEQRNRNTKEHHSSRSNCRSCVPFLHSLTAPSVVVKRRSSLRPVIFYHTKAHPARGLRAPTGGPAGLPGEVMACG